MRGFLLGFAGLISPAQVPSAPVTSSPSSLRRVAEILTRLGRRLGEGRLRAPYTTGCSGIAPKKRTSLMR